MKSTKSKNVIIAIWIALIAVTISSYGIVTAGRGTAEQGSGIPKIANISGSSEFYFVPPGDNRVWHIVKRYNETKQNYNTATYIFSSDSVDVINEYAGMPNQDPLNINLAQFISNANSFHN